MQLHVLGPAFGLPSIDAECLAAVALLQLHAPPQWSIILADDLTSHRLPYLQDGDERFESFKSIAKHLTGRRDIESPNKSRAKLDADSVALQSFLETHARTLLDISLYVSYENYSATRSAFTQILPWYANYIVPPGRRADARKRTAHLGISSIDVDDVHEDLSNRSSGGFETGMGKEKAFEADAKQRASLLLPNKNTVRSLLGRSEHSAVFKLHALADNCFGPLEDMLGNGAYFLGTAEPQVVDCLVYAYLVLMLHPDLPQAWLKNTMKMKYKKLVKFAEDMHERLRMSVDVEAVVVLSKCKTREEMEGVRANNGVSLPFEPATSASLVEVTKAVTSDLVSRIPVIGPTRTEMITTAQQRPPFWQNRYFPLTLATVAASLGLTGYYAFAAGLLVWPRGEAIQIFGRRKLSDYGHLGAALAGVSLLSQQTNDDVIFKPQDLTDNPVRVEVQVEKDGLP